MSKTFLDKNNNTLATVYETNEVVANPTLEGTEASLTGLKIGSTKYKVEGGGSGEAPTFYLHRLELVLLDGCDEQYKVYISYINTSDYAISSLTDLKNFVFNNSIGGGKIISTDKPCSQFFVEEDDYNPKAVPCCLFLDSNDTFNDTVAYNVLNYSSSLTLQSVSDFVVKY